jgi:hypothetical protein
MYSNITMYISTKYVSVAETGVEMRPNHRRMNCDLLKQVAPSYHEYSFGSWYDQSGAIAPPDKGVTIL